MTSEAITMGRAGAVLVTLALAMGIGGLVDRLYVDLGAGLGFATLLWALMRAAARVAGGLKKRSNPGEEESHPS